MFGGALGGHIKRDPHLLFHELRMECGRATQPLLAPFPLPGWTTGNFSNAFDNQGSLDGSTTFHDAGATRTRHGPTSETRSPGNVIPSTASTRFRERREVTLTLTFRASVVSATDNYLRLEERNNIDGWSRGSITHNARSPAVYGTSRAQNESFPLPIDQASPVPPPAVSSNPPETLDRLVLHFTPSFLAIFAGTYHQTANATSPHRAGLRYN